MPTPGLRVLLAAHRRARSRTLGAASHHVRPVRRASTVAPPPPPPPPLPPPYAAPTDRVAAILPVLDDALAAGLSTPLVPPAPLSRIAHHLRALVSAGHHRFLPSEFATTDLTGRWADDAQLATPHGAFLLHPLQAPVARYMRVLAMRSAWARLRPHLAPLFSLGRQPDPPWLPYHDPQARRLDDHLVELFLLLWTRTTTNPTMFAPVLAHARRLLMHPIPPQAWINVAALGVEMRQPHLASIVAHTAHKGRQGQLDLLSDDARRLPSDVYTYLTNAGAWTARALAEQRERNLAEGVKAFAPRPLQHLPTARPPLPPHRPTTTLHQACKEDTLSLEDVFLNATMMAHGIGQADIVSLPTPAGDGQPIEGYALMELVFFEYAARDEVPSAPLLRTWLASLLFSRAWYAWRADTAMEALASPLLDRFCSCRSREVEGEETPNWARVLRLIHMMMDTDETSLSMETWQVQDRVPLRPLFTPEQMARLMQASKSFDTGRKDWLKERARARTSRKYTAPRFWLHPYVPPADVPLPPSPEGTGARHHPASVHEEYDATTRYLRRKVLVDLDEEAGLAQIHKMQMRGEQLTCAHIAPFVEMRLLQGRIFEAGELLQSATETYGITPSVQLLARLVSAASRSPTPSRIASGLLDLLVQSGEQGGEQGGLAALATNLALASGLEFDAPLMHRVGEVLALEDPEGLPALLQGTDTSWIVSPQLLLTVLLRLQGRKQFLAAQQLLARALEQGVAVDQLLRSKVFRMESNVRSWAERVQSLADRLPHPHLWQLDERARGKRGDGDGVLSRDEVRLAGQTMSATALRAELERSRRAQRLAEDNRLAVQLQMRRAPLPSPPGALDGDACADAEGDGAPSSRDAGEDLHLLSLARRAFMLRIFRRFAEGYYHHIARGVRARGATP